MEPPAPNVSSSTASAALVQQALDLMTAGELREARSVLAKGCKQFPKDYLIHYNLACVLSLLGQDLDDACVHLQRAVHFGYRSLETLQKDPDLKNVRGHSGYQLALSMCRSPPPPPPSGAKAHSSRPSSNPTTPPPTPNGPVSSPDNSSPSSSPLMPNSLFTSAPRPSNPTPRSSSSGSGRPGRPSKEGNGVAAKAEEAEEMRLDRVTKQDETWLQMQREEIQEQREELVRVREMWLKEQQAQRRMAEEERARNTAELLKQREELAKERSRFADDMEWQLQELAKERSQWHNDLLVQRAMLEEHRKKFVARYGPLSPTDRPPLGASSVQRAWTYSQPLLLSPYYLRIDCDGPKFEPLVPPDATLVLDHSEDAAMSVTTQQVMRDQIRSAQNDANKPREWSAFHSEYKREALAQQMLDYLVQEFSDNGGAFTHRNLDEFGGQLLEMCDQLKQMLSEPILLQLDSPVYVMGDIHGNFEDLLYFMKNLIQFGHLQYTSCKFVFLGDYVDRGDWSLEVVAYVFALKLLSPHTVFLLRGNHELHEVNGDIEGYGEYSFKAKCVQLLGNELGEDVWVAVNFVFQNLPLAAIVDGRVFCVHGGIPRYCGGVDKRMDLLRNPDFPRFNSVMAQPTDSEERAEFRQMALDLMWSDPATAEEESTLDGWGFGPNRGRDSSDILIYGEKAIEQFLSTFKLDVIVRAHEAKQAGVRLCKGGRVLTVFTTSAYCGGSNGAGAAYVAQGVVRMISVSLNTTKSRRVSDKFMSSGALVVKKPAWQVEEPAALVYNVTTTHPYPRKTESLLGPRDGRRRLESGQYEPPKYRPASAPATTSPGDPLTRGASTPQSMWPMPPPTSKVLLSSSAWPPQSTSADRTPSEF
eukprot:GGOE01049735.1.p1 GENE.GGOE01049735.1~~GGOE01049735.1.p1  ORF type:complete len:870 (-),score=284.69 GGOE01049735.1:7-2616(-)